MTKTVADDADWLRRREMEVAGPRGHVALTGTYELVGVLELPGAPGVWSAVPEGVSVAAPATSGLRVDGVLVDGVAVVPTDRLAEAEIVAAGVVVTIFRRGGQPVLRTYESAAPRRAHYDGIERFAHEQRWRVPAHLVRFGEPETALIPYQRDGVVRSHEVIGRLAFELEGRLFSVVAFGGHELPWFVFADETAGRSTYRPGRFLDVEDGGDDEQLIVDFNRAYLPPCAFSDHYNCPLPPDENRLAAAIEAGERFVRWRDDDLEAGHGRH
jgi:uncharacterized protein (DUF1684 family)